MDRSRSKEVGLWMFSCGSLVRCGHTNEVSTRSCSGEKSNSRKVSKHCTMREERGRWGGRGEGEGRGDRGRRGEGRWREMGREERWGGEGREMGRKRKEIPGGEGEKGNGGR